MTLKFDEKLAIFVNMNCLANIAQLGKKKQSTPPIPHCYTMNNTKQTQEIHADLTKELLENTLKIMPKKDQFDELDEYLDNDFLGFLISLKKELKTTEEAMDSFKKRNINIEKWLFNLEKIFKNYYLPTKFKLHFMARTCFFELMTTIRDCRKEMREIEENEDDYEMVTFEMLSHLIDMINSIVQVLTPELRIYTDI